jgi:Fic family protein
MSNRRNPSGWVWQSPSWPAFPYDERALAAPLARARLAQGRLLGKAEAVGAQGFASALRELWTEEAVATAAIEGEHLDVDAVRSSVARRLGIASSFTAAVPRHVEGLLDVMEDAAARWDSPLTEGRLGGWQAALFPTGYSGLRRIEVGGYRSHPEPMQIVSGPVGGGTVHYEAPPSAAVPTEMRSFLDWFDRTRRVTAGGAADGLVRAGLAHLWFESIHAFEDGNGRVGRAIVDMALAQDARLAHRLHGLSHEFRDRQSEYYDELNRFQRGSGDSTSWLLWFLEAFEASCVRVAALIDESVARARFWSDHKDVELNERQRKALNRMLEAGPGRFEGGMTARKYASLTKTSGPTATRELSGLVQNGLLVPRGEGRSRRYELTLPGWEWAPRPARKQGGDARRRVLRSPR